MKKSKVRVCSSGNWFVRILIALIRSGLSRIQESNCDSKQKQISFSVCVGRARRAMIARCATLGVGSCREMTKW